MNTNIKTWNEARTFIKELSALIKLFRTKKDGDLDSLITSLLEQRMGMKVLYPASYSRPYFSRLFRHWHIAMSELRGKERSQIEIPDLSNVPDEKIIAEIKTFLTKIIEEARHA